MSTSTKLTQKSLKQIEKMIGEKITLGRLIWAIRKADGIAQVEFAQMLGISRQHLCNIESDRTSISPERAKMYAEKLKYPEEQFIRLSLQDLVDRQGLNVIVNIKSGKRRKGGRTGELVYV